MNISSNELHDLLQFSIDIAQGAGEVTLKYFRRQPETSKKTDGSFVTIADREAEAYLRKQILTRFPNDGVLGEEEGERPGKSGRRWIIDPIDGTFAYVHGVPFFGVLIGLEVNSDWSLGVVNIPALNEIVYAAKGLGCFWNGARTQVSSTASLEESLLLCTDFPACERYGFEEAAKALQQKARTSRTWGDCYGYVLVATGRADVMLDPIMNLWDCAALLPILEEAGGTFTDWRGERTVEAGNAIATNRVLFEEVMSVIKSAQTE